MATPKSDETPSGAAPLPCPHCGADLITELLVLDDDAGREAVLVLDCPTGDFHLAVTEKDLRDALADEVVARLRLKGSAA